MSQLKKLQQQLKNQDADALLVINPYNQTYLLGFSGLEGALIITPDDQFAFTDGRFFEQLRLTNPDWTIIDNKKNELLDTLLQLSINRVLTELDSLSVTQWQGLQHPQLEIADENKLIEHQRMVKTPAELETLQEAATIADKVFDHALSIIRPGMSERQLATEMEYFGQKLGATSIAFTTIVASGFRSALPHGDASEKIINNNEIVILDFGFIYRGYYSDMTRTIAVGQIDEKLMQIHQIVLDAQTAIINDLKINQPLCEIDNNMRDFIEKKGFGPQFNHGTGHGLGIECHEYPTINKLSDEKLAANMLVTIEPGIYLPDVGGVRIEDDVYVDSDNNVHYLTNSPRELIRV